MNVIPDEPFFFFSHCTVDTRIDTGADHELFLIQSVCPNKASHPIRSACVVETHQWQRSFGSAESTEGVEERRKCSRSLLA